MHCRPGGLERVSQPLGSAHQPLRARHFADRDKDALARREAARECMGADIIEHLRIDRLRGTAQRHLAQRRQIGLGKEMAERPRRFLRDIDLAVFQPFDQFVGRDVHHLDLGHLQNRVRYRLSYPNAGEGGDDVVQALHMLDIDGGVDIDTGIEQFLDILIAFGVAAAGRVGVGEFIDQNERWPPFQYGVDVHLAQPMAHMVDRTSGNDLMPHEQRLGLLATVGLHDANHDIDSGLAPLHPVGQHFISLAHAGRRAKKYLEAATTFLRRLTQEGFGISAIRIVH